MLFHGICSDKCFYNFIACVSVPAEPPYERQWGYERQVLLVPVHLKQLHHLIPLVLNSKVLKLTELWASCIEAVKVSWSQFIAVILNSVMNTYDSLSPICYYTLLKDVVGATYLLLNTQNKF